MIASILSKVFEFPSVNDMVLGDPDTILETADVIVES